MKPQTQPIKLLTLTQLREKLGNRGRTSIYNDIKEGRLPAPKKIGGRNYFLESAVDDAVMGAVSEPPSEN